MNSIICWIIVSPFLFALTLFSVEVLLGLRPQPNRFICGTIRKTTVLMPAHNEGKTIGRTLDLLISVLHADAKILVVADNCVDDTAIVAQKKGVTVVERNSIHEKGKGYALAFGRDHLKADPPECVIVLDADCETDKRSLIELSSYCVEKGLPIQAKNILKPDISVSPMVQISNFAFWVKNVVRQRGIARMGGAALLNGTGMAFPWKIFENQPLATSSIVEDLALGIHLTKLGYGPIYLEQAKVLSASASEEATLSQRSRWELGFLSVARQFGISTTWYGLRTFNLSALLLGLDLMIPPLAMLILTTIFITAFLGIIVVFVEFSMAFYALALCMLIAFLLILVAWLCGGRNWLGISGLVRLPVYIIWKLPIVGKLLKLEKPSWNRTER